MKEKNTIKRKLDILINLAEQFDKVADLLKQDLDLKNISQERADICDYFDNYLSNIRDGIANNSSEILKDFEKNNVIKYIFDEPDLRTPKINICSDTIVQVSMPCNGGYLIASINEADDNTTQAALLYQPAKANTCPIELALSEVKSNELAESCGLPFDNEDIDTYIYSDVYDDEWTQKYTIKHEDVLNALIGEVS